MAELVKFCLYPRKNIFSISCDREFKRKMEKNTCFGSF